jgi:hypothetical protein
MAAVIGENEDLKVTHHHESVALFSSPFIKLNYL